MVMSELGLTMAVSLSGGACGKAWEADRKDGEALRLLLTPVSFGYFPEALSIREMETGVCPAGRRQRRSRLPGFRLRTSGVGQSWRSVPEVVAPTASETGIGPFSATRWRIVDPSQSSIREGQTMRTNVASLALPVVFALAAATATGQDLRLVTAVADQDTPTVQALIAEGVDVNAPRADGATALLWATHWDALDTVDLLLRSGADVNATDDHGVTALARAAENAGFPMVERLLGAGADANAAQTSGLTPLMTAARTGNLAIVRTLLDHGADVNAATVETGSTALMWALAAPHPDTVRLLLDRGADPARSTTVGFSPLMFAARNGDIEMAEALIATGVDVNDTNTDGTHVLPFAIVSGQDEFALFLLEQGADPHGQMGGVSALHAAAGGVGTWLAEWSRRHGRAGGRLTATARLTLVEALLARGADPNTRITSSAMLMF
ncbi:MAG: hypothetical protein E2P06_02545 [Acidobacteria bacterium]|nr:MAG: hypothetical protein E2P06_02545 [Acidobacteriota bacterium]